MAIFVPRSLVNEATQYARETLTNALRGLFGLVEKELERRRSFEFAHEKALFHQRLAQLLESSHGRAGVIGLKIWRRTQKIRRHKRLEMRWSAKAYAREPQLAAKCGICPAPASAG